MVSPRGERGAPSAETGAGTTGPQASALRRHITPRRASRLSPAPAALILRPACLQQLALNAVTPREAFAAAGVPASPDYTDPAVWTALPERLEEADTTPSTIRRSTRPPAPTRPVSATPHLGHGQIPAVPVERRQRLPRRVRAALPAGQPHRPRHAAPPRGPRALPLREKPVAAGLVRSPPHVGTMARDLLDALCVPRDFSRRILDDTLGARKHHALEYQRFSAGLARERARTRGRVPRRPPVHPALAGLSRAPASRGISSPAPPPHPAAACGWHRVAPPPTVGTSAPRSRSPGR